MNNKNEYALKARIEELKDIFENREKEFIESINNCTETQHLRKLVLYYNENVKEMFEEISSLESSILNHKEVIRFSNQMFEWIKKSCSETDLSDYGYESISQYIDSCFEEEKELLESIK